MGSGKEIPNKNSLLQSKDSRNNSFAQLLMECSGLYQKQQFGVSWQSLSINVHDRPRDTLPDFLLAEVMEFGFAPGEPQNSILSKVSNCTK
jgi:hypothetical protein